MRCPICTLANCSPHKTCNDWFPELFKCIYCDSEFEAELDEFVTEKTYIINHEQHNTKAGAIFIQLSRPSELAKETDKAREEKASIY